MIQPRVIFVFGSNLAGKHIGGAAREAAKFWGAVMGKGEGHYGESYALPTMDRSLAPRELEEIADSVETFLVFTAAHHEWTFYVTPLGCGIAGFTEAEIAPMFTGAPSNVQLPKGWRT